MEFVPLTVHGFIQESISVFHDFATQYSAEMPEANRVFRYMEAPESIEPFSYNGCVFFNQKIWDKIGFTDEELKAMLAHEIGHAVDTLVRTDNNQPERERNADIFAVTHGFGCKLCSALMKCISSGLYCEDDKVIEGMKERIIHIHYEELNQCCIILKGVHSEPKNEWLIAVYNHWDEIQNTPLIAERVRILENLASQIKGIGPTTIDETLTWFS